MCPSVQHIGKQKRCDSQCFFFCFIFVVSFVILRFFFYSYFCSCPAFTGNIFIFFVLARVPCSVFPGALFLFSFIYSCILLCIFFVYCRCIFVASETETHTHIRTPIFCSVVRFALFTFRSYLVLPISCSSQLHKMHTNTHQLTIHIYSRIFVFHEHFMS